MKLNSTTLSRRDFLRVLGGASAFACLPGWLRAESPHLTTVSLLHTTDLHGHILPTVTYQGVEDVGGLARCATQIRAWKRANPHHLLVDLGDVYQGTQVGLSTRGRIMIDAFNHLNYDAWVIGNHDFDWGIEPVHDALANSSVPVLCANCTMEGYAPGDFPDDAHPFARMAPFIMKEVAGLKIGFIGVTTTGMPYWLHESQYEGMSFLDPVEPVRLAIRQLDDLKADAIVLGGHMGTVRGGDNFGNRVASLLTEFPQIAIYLAGHTHQDVPARRVRGVPYTQANYHGIHVGRVDLVFHRETRTLVDVDSQTFYMDNSVEMDPGILSMAQADLEEAEQLLARRVGRLGEPLTVQSRIARPSGFEELMAAAIAEALHARNVEVDGVVHGVFFAEDPFPAGDQTIADIWKMVPYENRIVTARLTRTEIVGMLEDLYGGWFRRSLMGMRVDSSGFGEHLRIHEIYDRNGVPLRPRRRYTIAFNSYDAQSGGRRFMRTRGILRRPSSEMAAHPVMSRDALIDYFAARDVVWPSKLGIQEPT